MVPGERIELSRGCPHWILSPARLPIPPSRHKASCNRPLNYCPNFLQRVQKLYTSPALANSQLETITYVALWSLFIQIVKIVYFLDSFRRE